MKPEETELQMVLRHVAEGEIHIEGQRVRIAKLQDSGLNTDVACDLLIMFLDVQSLHCDHLSRLQTRLGL